MGECSNAEQYREEDRSTHRRGVFIQTDINFGHYDVASSVERLRESSGVEGWKGGEVWFEPELLSHAAVYILYLDT